MSNKLDKVKEIIKKNIEDAKCGIFFTRNIVGDPMSEIYCDTYDGVEIDICYKYEYFEVFGLTKDEQKEIKNFYDIIKDYDKFDEFGFFNPFTFDEEKEEELDFVPQHPKKPVQIISWISVEDGLPKEDELVIISVTDDSGDNKYRYTTCGWYFNDTWIVDNERINTSFVTAWMPLPEPYKEE